MHNKLGRLVTLEGIEGSGKSTQIVKIKSLLDGLNISSMATCEPGGAHRLKVIRDIFLFPPDSSSFPIHPVTESFMLMADRSQHVRQVMLPALKKGTWVISDRYTDSAVAYQGYGRGMELCMLRSLNYYATENTVPDVTFLLDLDVEKGLERVRKRACLEKKKTGSSKGIDRFERESVIFHTKVREGYLRMADMESERFIVINADRGVDAVFDNIRSVLFSRFL